MPSPYIWRIELFGVLRVTSGKRSITRFRTQMTGSLLAYLAYHHGRPQPREVLIEQFWPDCDPKAGRGRLSLALTSLRAQFTQPDSGAPLLLTDTFTVGLNPDVFETDVADFQEALKHATYASGPSERLTWLDKATACYTNDLLAGRYESWIIPEQERLRDSFLKASAQLIRLREKAGQGDLVVALARRATSVAPLHETAWCDLIRLLIEKGEKGEASRATKDAQGAFEQEGVRVPETILRLAHAVEASARRSRGLEEALPLAVDPPFTSPPIPAFAAGTFTVLLAEGDAAPLAVMAAVGQKAGGLRLVGPEETLWLAFSSGHAAVTAAVAGMRDAEGALRAALDTGFIDAAIGGGVDGASLGTLPLLAAAAHKGQILCTEVTAALAWPAPKSSEETDAEQAGSGPPARKSTGHRLRDLGRFRIDEGETPRRVFQAESAAIPPALFPPLRAAQGDAPTLPPTYTRFFGRESELTRLAVLLTEAGAPPPAPLITLVGMGGIGKTRLAIEVAARIQAFFQGRVWFAALAELQAIANVPEVIRDALRLPQNSSVDTMEQIADHLNVAPALLILDNMEQFVASGDAARVVRNLRARVPSLACLITSRQMIGVEGEHAFLVAPLTQTSPPLGTSVGASEENASIALFVDRARAVRPDFAVNPSNSGALVRLCALLEGIPLALELAAARSGLLTPTHMLTHMEERFALLQSRRRDMPARHRSLWAAIDSSYQYLPPDAQRFFERLSVFRGGWTLQSAQSVCCPLTAQTAEADRGVGYSPSFDAVALETLAELQESSLISLMESGGSATPRFQMLETVRVFACERLREQGDEAATLQRHLAFFADLSAEAEPHLTSGGTSQQEWLHVLDAEHDNLRVALVTATPALQLHMAIDLHRFWLTRGHAVEGRRRLKDALAAAQAADDASLTHQAKAQNALGVLAWASGALTDAETYFVQCLTTYRKADAPDTNPDCARALNNIGIVSSHLGNFDRARVSYEASLQIYRATGDTLRQSMVMTNLGGVLLYLKDYAAARQVLEESLPIQRAAGDNFSVLRTLNNLAEVALYQGDIRTAADALRKSIRLRRTLGDRSSPWDTLVTTAMILEESNKNVEAVTLWGVVQNLLTVENTELAPANAEVAKNSVKSLREKLQSSVFEKCYAKGHAMDFEQAFAFAEENL